MPSYKVIQRKIQITAHILRMSDKANQQLCRKDHFKDTDDPNEIALLIVNEQGTVNLSLCKICAKEYFRRCRTGEHDGDELAFLDNLATWWFNKDDKTE